MSISAPRRLETYPDPTDPLDPTDPYLYENGFYLKTGPERLAKLLAHHELYQRILDLDGAIVEAGVFKGASLFRWAKFRALLESDASRSIVGFDIFGEFPEATSELDAAQREQFVEQAGSVGPSTDDLHTCLSKLGLNENVELIQGDVCETIPKYALEHPDLRIALLHVDVDLYEPTRTTLEFLWPRVVPGGIAVLDDHGHFPGATRAIEEILADTAIERPDVLHTPAFAVKPKPCSPNRN